LDQGLRLAQKLGQFSNIRRDSLRLGAGVDKRERKKATERTAPISMLFPRKLGAGRKKWQ